MLDWAFETAEPKEKGAYVQAHCGKCGRFARYIEGSVRQDYWGEWEPGAVVCKVHGDQEASWPG